MTRPQQQTPNMPPPDTILHLGAGTGRDLDTWRETGAKRIVLVEPNPELLPELRRRTQGVDEVEIIPAAIAANAGRESLYLYNFPLLASLREPTGLRSILPGLQQTGRAMVETKRLGTLVDELQLDPDGRYRLIIDAPGMEAEIVDQLIADDLASIFTAVDVTAGREPLYQDSQPLQALIERLEAAGYEPGAVDTGNDPDWPRATLRYSRHAAENKRLAEELERLQARLRSQNEEFSRRFAELSQERDEANAKLESEQKNARTAAEENEKLQKQNKDLTDELEKQKAAARKAQKQIDSIRAERDEFEARVKQSEEKIKSLEGKLSDATQDARHARSDVAVALRLQNLRENDLKDLQQRYGKLQETNQQQRELLAKLHQRLSAAAHYLRLNADGEEIRSPQVEQLVRALTGSDAEDQ